MSTAHKQADWLTTEEYLDGSEAILKLPGIGVEISMARLCERTAAGAQQPSR